MQNNEQLLDLHFYVELDRIMALVIFSLKHHVLGNFKTAEDIFVKLITNIKYYQTMYPEQELLLCLYFLWNYVPV